VAEAPLHHVGYVVASMDHLAIPAQEYRNQFAPDPFRLRYFLRSFVARTHNACGPRNEMFG
jgi:hypothetical protein